MPFGKKRCSSDCPAGFGALAMTVSPPARDGAGDDGGLQRIAEIRHERGEVGDRCVIV